LLSGQRPASIGRDNAHGWLMFVLFAAMMAGGAVVVFFIFVGL